MHGWGTKAGPASKATVWGVLESDTPGGRLIRQLSPRDASRCSDKRQRECPQHLYSLSQKEETAVRRRDV